jgi:Bax protein
MSAPIWHDDKMIGLLVVFPGLRWIPASVAGTFLAGTFLAGIGGCTGGNGKDADQADQSHEVVEFRSYAEIEGLLEKLNYSQEIWDAGIRELPRLYVTNIPSRWRTNSADEIPVAAKKRLFFRLLGPGALKANELIEADRTRLARFIDRRDDPVSEADLKWFEDLATRYRMIDAERDSDQDMQQLLARIDIVPASLVLAQAAEESGWGTSRFADVGNALFGQWTWNEGVEPLARRTGKGDYNIARFESPLDSINAYMLNLNSHPAYEGMREQRRQMRESGQPLSGWELAKSLTSYSERGAAYVELLHTIMRVNALASVDNAYLADATPIYLTPVGEGSD